MATALLSLLCASLQSGEALEGGVKSRLPGSPAHESFSTSCHPSTYIIFCNEDAGWPKEREYRSGTGNRAENQAEETDSPKVLAMFF